MGSDRDFDQLIIGLTEALSEPDEHEVPDLRLIQGGCLADSDDIDVVAIRRNSGLSQAAFASRIGVPVATIRNWEQGRRSPQGPARVLLALLDHDPRIVEKTLQGSQSG